MYIYIYASIYLSFLYTSIYRLLALYQTIQSNFKLKHPPLSLSLSLSLFLSLCVTYHSKMHSWTCVYMNLHTLSYTYTEGYILERGDFLRKRSQCCDLQVYIIYIYICVCACVCVCVCVCVCACNTVKVQYQPVTKSRSVTKLVLKRFVNRLTSKLYQPQVISIKTE